ncbi:MAG: hypothetical protein ABEI75_04275 [Halobaculum sp.]
MSVHLTRLADAQITIAVSRAAPGDLAEGVEARLRRADAVEGVESLALEGIQPGLNDLTAEVSATVAVAADADDPETLAARLEETFAVEQATVERVRTVEPAGDAASEEVVDAT